MADKFQFDGVEICGRGHDNYRSDAANWVARRCAFI